MLGHVSQKCITYHYYFYESQNNSRVEQQSSNSNHLEDDFENLNV